MNITKQIAYILVLIGGLNWGVFGLTGGINLVTMLTMGISMFENIVYVLVGLSAVYLIAVQRTLGSCSKADCECEVQIAEPTSPSSAV